MRWQRLFADLAAQATAEEAAEQAAEIADRSRLEAGRVELAARLHDATNRLVSLGLVSATRVAGQVLAVGVDWLLLEQNLEPSLGRSARDLLVPISAIASVRGRPGDRELPPVDPVPLGSLVRSLRLGHALRSLARDRQGLMIELTGGPHLCGTIDRVGSDYLELAEHASDELRRRETIHSRQLIAFAAIQFVRRIDDYKVSS